MKEIKKDKMNVLMVSGSYPPIHCGVADGTKILCDYLSRFSDVKVSVLTSDKAEKDANPKITTLNVVNKWAGLKYLRLFMKTLKQVKPDVINFQFPASEYKNSSVVNFILLPILLRLKGCKVVYTIHEYSYNGRMSKLARIPAILFSNRIVVVEEQYRREIRKKFGKFINQKKVSLVHIGSNIPQSTASDEYISELRKKYISREDEKIFAYFGWINDKKCLDIVFNAFAELKKEGSLNSKFLIIGDFNSEKCGEKLFGNLIKIIEENGLGDYIVPVGYMPDSKVGDYFKISDAALMLFKDGVSPRNGTVLAARQEGVKIITTKPVSEEEIFDSAQFSLISNSVEAVKKEIINVQNNVTERFSIKNSDEWINISQKYREIYYSVKK